MRSSIQTRTDVPTADEASLLLEINAWFGLSATRITPPEVISWVNREVNKAFDQPDVRARYTALGASLSLCMPEEFAKFVRAENSKWGPVIEQAGGRLR